MGQGRFFKYIIPMTLCLVLYQNCGVSKFTIGGEPPNSGFGNEDLDSEGDPLQSLNCDDPNQYKTTRLQLVFNDPGVVCEWGQGESLAQQDAHIMAINRQAADIRVPDGAIACGYNVEVQRQPFRYDDIFYLSVNDVTVATNALFSLENFSGDLMTLNWVNVRGTPWPGDFLDSTNHDYCLGELQNQSTCSWAASDTDGEIALSFNQSVFDGVLRPTGNSLELAIVGDNDATDCRHTGLTVDVDVFYVD